MRLLITGGAGFIGSNLSDELIELGYEVAVLDNLRSGKKENIHRGAVFYQVDINDREEIKRVFKSYKPDAVFHLAAQNEVPYSMSHPQEDLETNIKGTLNLLESCKEAGIRKFIYSNTGGAYYGNVPDSRLPITEDEPVVRPTSYYGVSKASAEQYLKLYGETFGLSWISLRYANVYGPRQDGNKEAGIVAIFTTKLVRGETPTINGDGLHTRDYVYVGDVVDANIRALDYCENDYFNIATGQEISNNQVFGELVKSLKLKIKPIYGPERPGDARRNCLSPKKAGKLLGWKPKVSFAEGVKFTVDYYEKELGD